MASTSNPPTINAGSTQRRAWSVPNLREHQSAAPQRIVPWDDAAAASPTSPVSVTHASPAATPSPAVIPDAAPVQPVHTTQRPRRRRRHTDTNNGGSGWRYWWRRTSRFFGYGRGNEARKDTVTLVFTLCWGTAQIAAVTLLLIAGGLTSSPPNVNEWESRICDKPLGPWAVVWCLRVIVGFASAIFTYRVNRRRHRSHDMEIGGAAPGTNTAAVAPMDGVEGGDNNDTNVAGNEAHANANPAQSNVVVSRINTMTSFFSLAWFIVAHVFLYTSVDTCRKNAPHLWWANFAIVCLMYVVVLEVLVVGAIIFILVPLVFLVVNIILVCMGRAPLQPGGDIHPEIPKLSQRAVDKIPLVLYIPPPPEDFLDVTPPPQAHLYPPTRMTSLGSMDSTRSRRSMFRFLKRRRTRLKGKGKGKDVDSNVPNEKSDGGNAWEDRWEKGDFPFVRLEENRAACAICLMDFEPPKKLDASPSTKAEPSEAQAEADVPEIVTVHEPQSDDEVNDVDDNLRLQDAGEGVQPLRLLGCGHVFHKTCLDPWLVDVSGRCPTCQQPVDISEDEPPQRRQRRNGNP